MSQDNSIIWKPIVGLEKRFLISNTGTIKSLLSRTGKGKIRKLWTNKLGYSTLQFKVNGKMKAKLVHRLVAEAFLPNPNNLKYVNHIDNNPKNNKVTNLEWCTQSQNILHAVRSGNWKTQNSHHLSKLNPKDVKIIRQRIKLGENNQTIASNYNVSRNAIRLIKIGKNWKSLD